MGFQKAIIFLCLVFIIIPTFCHGECTCDPEDDEGRNRKEALKYKLAAIFSIFFASTIGVCIPMLGRIFPILGPERDLFFVVKSFAAGVILATGFIHVLPDAFKNLTNPYLKEHPWGEFPFTGFVAMLAAIGTLMVDAHATSHFMKLRKPPSENKMVGGGGGGEDGVVVPVVHSHGGHTHGGVAPLATGDAELLRNKVISQVLELGIIVHSVIIGIALGASETPKTIKPLVVALSFHQFFEGMGLGGCIVQAKFKGRVVVIMTLFFSLTTSIGIIIGIGIMNVYKENSPTALIVQGLFDSASAGILIYMALVDFLAADFMNPRMQSKKKLHLMSDVSLLIGAGAMSLIAKWA
ncbi:hypothetical protein Leryth_026701 [Lithospermum erythrorhizon]|nr:hypothetical protein Leryth_026701 [Lithospermum erythrorhizon]